MSVVESSGLAMHPRRRNSGITDLILERSEVVLWSLSPSGLVLHHVKNGAYLELDAAGYTLWAYLDGARSVGEAVATTAVAHPDHTARQLLDAAGALFAHGFAQERK